MHGWGFHVLFAPRTFWLSIRPAPGAGRAHVRGSKRGSRQAGGKRHVPADWTRSGGCARGVLVAQKHGQRRMGRVVFARGRPLYGAGEGSGEDRPGEGERAVYQGLAPLFLRTLAGAGFAGKEGGLSEGTRGVLCKREAARSSA